MEVEDTVEVGAERKRQWWWGRWERNRKPFVAALQIDAQRSQSTDALRGHGECGTLAGIFLHKFPARETLSASLTWMQCFRTDDSYWETMSI